MEEILSSIKRIIAEEGDAAVASRARRTPRPAPVAKTTLEPAGNDDEVLELSEPAPEIEANSPVPMPIGAPDVPHQPIAASQPIVAPGEPIVSPGAVEATRDRLEALSRMVVKPEPAGAAPETLEGLVREMLRPMLREWLDANLPRLVDEMVAREIARITGR